MTKLFIPPLGALGALGAWAGGREGGAGGIGKLTDPGAGCLAETSVRFSSVRLHLRPGFGPVAVRVWLRFGPVLGRPRFGSVRFHVQGRFGPCRFGSV